MIWELFVVGSIWFWALIVVEAVWLFGLVKYEKGWASGSSLLLTAALLCLFGNFNVFSWITYHPWNSVFYAAGYLVLGVVWSLVKWRLLCGDVRDKYLEVRQEFFDEHHIGETVIPKNLAERWLSCLRCVTWADYFEYHRHRISDIESIKDIIPNPQSHKRTILFWMAYWPLSMFWFFLHDMLERLFQELYNFFAGLFRRIANSVFAGVVDDIEPAVRVEKERKLKEAQGPRR